jgi:two-component system, cell cycle sensor histidine kinase and response regulator CckA
MFSITKGGTATVLLIDDDDQVRGMCKSFLEEIGFRVLDAGDGLEALLLATQWKGAIDLVITDVVMPKMGGAELGRVFSEIWPEVNVLYMSGSPKEIVGQELPPDCSFLPKPFAFGDLVSAVLRCVPSFAEA